MGCNCKKKLQLEEKYGVKAEESVLQKTYRTFWKVSLLFIGALLGVVLVPTIVCVLIFNQVFMGGKGLTLPKKLSKYILQGNGKKL